MSSQSTDNDSSLRGAVRHYYGQAGIYVEDARRWGRDHPRLWRIFWLIVFLAVVALGVWAIWPNKNASQPNRFGGAQPVNAFVKAQRRTGGGA